MGQKHGDPAIHCTGRCSPELRPSLSKSAAGGVLRESLDGVRWKSGGSLQEGGQDGTTMTAFVNQRFRITRSYLLYQFHRPYFPFDPR